jgi:hypothetical protein
LAERWALRAKARHRVPSRCEGCRTRGGGHLHCAGCEAPWCHPCLELPPASLWEVSFRCLDCELEAWAQGGSRQANPELKALLRSLLQTRAAALKSGTWANYKRCVAQMWGFEEDTDTRVFLVTT